MRAKAIFKFEIQLNEDRIIMNCWEILKSDVINWNFVNHKKRKFRNSQLQKFSKNIILSQISEHLTTKSIESSNYKPKTEWIFNIQ